MEELLEALGDRRITICRELTKKYETAFRTTFQGALDHFETEEPRGECVIVIEGKSPEEIKKEKEQTWESMSITEHMDVYLSQGIEKKEAMKLVAKDRGIGKRDVYQMLVGRTGIGNFEKKMCRWLLSEMTGGTSSFLQKITDK